MRAFLIVCGLVLCSCGGPAALIKVQCQGELPITLELETDPITLHAGASPDCPECSNSCTIKVSKP